MVAKKIYIYIFVRALEGVHLGQCTSRSVGQHENHNNGVRTPTGEIHGTLF